MEWHCSNRDTHFQKHPTQEGRITTFQQQSRFSWFHHYPTLASEPVRFSTRKGRELRLTKFKYKYSSPKNLAQMDTMEPLDQHQPAGRTSGVPRKVVKLVTTKPWTTLTSSSINSIIRFRAQKERLEDWRYHSVGMTGDNFIWEIFFSSNHSK